LRFEEDSMNPKKQKEKERRRARKLAEQAWEAANQGNLDLAEKIIRRAVSAQEDNPVLWNDQGVLLTMRHKEDEADLAFQAALSLAPSYAEPYAHLAALRLRQGRTNQAVALQSLAVKHDPRNAEFAERLRAYQSLEGQIAAPSSSRKVDPPICLPDADESRAEWEQRLTALDWHALENRLTRDGFAVIAGLVDGSTCERLRGMFDEDVRFAKTVVMDRPDFGRGVYRYFGTPVPSVVDQLRRAVYPHVAHIANGWQQLLAEPGDFPLRWDDFRDDCRRAGQSTPTPILLKYGPGGFNALHRDLRGEVFFPIQMAVLLSPRCDQGDACPDAFQGGEFLLCDVPEGRKSRRQEVSLGMGDAVLFCTRDRLARVGRVYGLQPVKHGVARVAAGTRYALGAPFHEYR
jgi:uncharacterized protein